MKKSKPSESDPSRLPLAAGRELRRQAEAKLSKQKSAATPMTKADTLRLVQELQVHQIELEMQNEELIQARAEAEAIHRQFTDLYDFAPVGYFTLARDGTISRVNLIGANLLGAERAKLVNRRLGLFVSAESRPAFNGFLEQVFISGVNETCEIALLKNVIDSLWVRIEATCIEDGQGCRAVMVDISERKRVEDALRNAGQQWKSTFDATSDAICLLDNEQRILRANRAMTELFGKNFTEIIGKHCWEVAHGIQQPLQNCPITRMKNSRKRENIELAIGAGTFDVTVDPVFNENNELIGAVHIIRDITQRKQIENQLLVTQRLSQSTIDALSAHLCVLDENGVILFVNRAWREFADANSSIQGNYFIGANYLNICDNASGKYSEESAVFAHGIRSVIRGDTREFILEYPCDSPDEVRWFIGRVTRFHGDSSSNCVVIAHENISERKRAEESLRQAEEKYRSIFENAMEGIYQSTPEGRFITVNPALARMWGYASPQELIASITDIKRQIYVDPDRRAAMWRALEEQGEVRQVESQTHKKDGSTMWVSENMRAARDANGVFICEGTFEDITARKQAEEALRQSQELYQMLFEQSADAVFLLDLDGRHIQVNQRAVEMLGYTRDEILKLSVREISAQTDESQNVLSRLIKGEIIPPYERLFRKKNGDLIHVEPHITLICDLEGHPYRVQSIVRDITERVQAKEKILHINRLYATISQINQTIVRAQNLATLFPEICRVAIEHGKFRMAWIGLVDDSYGHVKPIAFAGEEQGYLSNISIIVHDPELGGGPTGTAIRAERCIICQDIANDPRMLPWRAQAIQRGYRSSASVPIFQKNRPIGALTVYASEPQGFNDDDQKLLDEIGQDISYAVDSLNTESERKQAENALRESEEKFRTLIEQSTDGIILIDEQGYIIGWNTAEERITGIPKARALGAPFWEIQYQVIMPERRAKITHEYLKKIFIESLQTALADQLGKPLDVEIVSVNGEHKFIQQTSFLIKTEKGNRMAAIVRDITERVQANEALRASQEKFRIAQDMSPDGFTILRPVRDAQQRVVDFTWVYENAAVARLNGTDPEAVVGRRLLDLFPGHSGTPFLRAYQQVAESRETCIFESSYSGESMTKPTSLRIVVVPMGDDIAILAQDITERVQAEDEIKKQLGELQRWYNATLGREMRVLELKREVNELLGNASQAPRYPSAESQDEK